MHLSSSSSLSWSKYTLHSFIPKMWKNPTTLSFVTNNIIFYLSRWPSNIQTASFLDCKLQSCQRIHFACFTLFASRKTYEKMFCSTCFLLFASKLWKKRENAQCKGKRKREYDTWLLKKPFIIIHFQLNPHHATTTTAAALKYTIPFHAKSKRKKITFQNYIDQLNSRCLSNSFTKPSFRTLFSIQTVFTLNVTH